MLNKTLVFLLYIGKVIPSLLFFIEDLTRGNSKEFHTEGVKKKA